MGKKIPSVVPALRNLITKNRVQSALWVATGENKLAAAADPEVVAAQFKEFYNHEATILAVLMALDERIAEMEKANLSFMMRVIAEMPQLVEEFNGYIEERAENVGMADQNKAKLRDLLDSMRSGVDGE